MTFLSLFAWIEGFGLGFERAGLTCVGQVEINKQCRSILERHWPSVPKFSDIEKCGAHNLPKADVVCGGFPCQDLSSAGKGKGLTGGTRSALFFEMARVVDELRPEYLVWENVPGLLPSDDGRDFPRVLRTLADIGYGGAWRTLDARYFGVAQRRRRVFGVFARPDIGVRRCGEILALTEGLSRHRPKGGAQEEGVGAGDADGVAKCLTGSANRHDETRQTYVVYGIQERAGSESLTSGPAGKGYKRGLAYTLEARHHPQAVAVCRTLDCSTDKFKTLVIQQGNSNQNGVGVSEGPAYTLDLATPQAVYRGGLGVRRLTPREYERLQGFPDDWTRWGADGKEFKDGPRYRMCGNAVVVPVAQWIARRLLTVVSDTH